MPPRPNSFRGSPRIVPVVPAASIILALAMVPILAFPAFRPGNVARRCPTIVDLPGSLVYSFGIALVRDPVRLGLNSRLPFALALSLGSGLGLLRVNVIPDGDGRIFPVCLFFNGLFFSQGLISPFSHRRFIFKIEIIFPGFLR